MDDVAPFNYLSLFSSISICLIFSIGYVFSVYILSPSTQRFDRNQSNVICRRFIAVLIVCLMIYIFLNYQCQSNVNINHWLGFRTNILSIWKLLFYPILLILMLYTGPVVQWIVLEDWRNYLPHWDVNDKLIFLRNYLIGPATEEFVFRSSILCILYPHISLFSAVFLSPLFFGLAHFHHMLEHFYRNNSEQPYRRRSLVIIFLNHLFQFFYTYIFGVFSSFLFIRTGHFLPSFIVHSLCNSLGMPDLISLRNEQENSWRKILILICYFIGMWLFSMNLFYLTQSKFYYLNDSNLVIYRHWSNEL